MILSCLLEYRVLLCIQNVVHFYSAMATFFALSSVKFCNSVVCVDFDNMHEVNHSLKTVCTLAYT